MGEAFFNRFESMLADYEAIGSPADVQDDVLQLKEEAVRIPGAHSTAALEDRQAARTVDADAHVSDTASDDDWTESSVWRAIGQPSVDSSRGEGEPGSNDPAQTERSAATLDARLIYAKPLRVSSSLIAHPPSLLERDPNSRVAHSFGRVSSQHEHLIGGPLHAVKRLCSTSYSSCAPCPLLSGSSELPVGNHVSPLPTGDPPRRFKAEERFRSPITRFLAQAR